MHMNPRLKTLREYGEALVIALLLVLVIRASFVQAFKIPSGSMLETLQIGDHILVSRILYGLKFPFTDWTLLSGKDPEHGDIVVFVPPHEKDMDFIKRVIGVPGDTLEIKDKVVIRNGQALKESYVQHRDPLVHQSGKRDNMEKVTVPPGKYFCMGDNRDESNDSRFFGYVDRDKIKGKAWLIYWSWSSFSDVRWSRIGHLF